MTEIKPYSEEWWHRLDTRNLLRRIRENRMRKSDYKLLDKISVNYYDSIREITIYAMNTTGKEWVQLKGIIKELLKK